VQTVLVEVNDGRYVAPNTHSAHAVPDATFKSYPTDVLRVAVVADWQAKPEPDAIQRDHVHLLMTAGDNIACRHRMCGVGVKDCTEPYGELIDRYPDLFRSTPFMPIQIKNLEGQVLDRKEFGAGNSIGPG
jgi:hypothetical protein